MPDVIERQCVDCGENIEVTVHEDKTYTGGHYFGMPTDEWEYWECDDCYRDTDTERGDSE